MATLNLGGDLLKLPPLDQFQLVKINQPLAIDFIGLLPGGQEGVIECVAPSFQN